MSKSISLCVLSALLLSLGGCSISSEWCWSIHDEEAPKLETPWDKMSKLTPRGYVAYKTPTPILIDGKADETAWKSVPWTKDFADIEGSPDPKVTPRFRTRAKLLWSDTHLYVYCEMEEPHVWAKITKKNEVVYFDNDFEIFLDPDSDNQNYYEFEVNALNTIWELNLKKTYDDGWQYDPEGIKGDGPKNLVGLKSAVHVRGTINDPSDTDQGWSVEVAIPMAELKQFCNHCAFPPTDGQYWRLGLSRVEWIADIIDGKYQRLEREDRPENNWVFSPVGIVAMHRPEQWGYLQFSTHLAQPGLKPITFTPEPTAPIRNALMELYHAQRAYREKYGKYAGTIKALGLDTDAKINLAKDGQSYTATFAAKIADGTSRTFTVRDDSLLLEVKK